MSVPPTVYGVAIAPPEARDALEAQWADGHGETAGGDLVELFTVGDSEHTILGVGCKALEPNTYLTAASLPAARQKGWDGALREYVDRFALTVHSGPDWLLVHDLS
ncbi:hypothetical protein [Streptomyces humi]